jgi:hypothetical protein
MSHLVDPLEELRELGQQVDDLPDYDDTELHSLALPSEGLDHKLKGDLLQGAVDDAVLDDGAVELGYLL